MGRMMRCSNCLVDKDLEEFHKNSARKTGHDCYCKSCRNLLRKTIYYNKEREVAAAMGWNRRNPEKVKASNVTWVKKNRYVATHDATKHRLKKSGAMPKWANEFFIKEAYHLAALRTKMTGFVWHVDHIIPLNGEKVCGLHVENNLQVIPAVDNLRKNNQFGV